MMGKQSGQIQTVILDIDSMIPEEHLLRQIKNCVNFDLTWRVPDHSTFSQNR